MSSETHLQNALAFHQAGDLARAEVSYRAVLMEEPTHPHAMHNLGVVAMQRGNLTAALPLFVRVLELSPGTAEAWLSLASCRYQMGDWEESMHLIEQALGRDIRHPQLDTLRQTMVGDERGHKVFCVGRNKTGTTSLEAALQSLGLRMGLQARGEMLRDDWAVRNFKRVIELCKAADAFQDVPFSSRFTFQAMDMHFPGSKFILTVRDSPEQWFDSMVRFQTKLVNKGRVPTAEDLRNFEYRYKGYLWDGFLKTYSSHEADLYRKEVYIQNYDDHNRSVIEYFRHRPDDLLVLNVNDGDAMPRLCSFLGISFTGQPMPHLNRSV